MKIDEGYSESNLTKSECFGAKYLKVGVEYGDWRQVLKVSSQRQRAALTSDSPENLKGASLSPTPLSILPQTARQFHDRNRRKARASRAF